MTLRSLMLAASLSVLAVSAHAQGYWLPVGDQRLRDDLTLLVDEGVLRLPMMVWPLPMADVRDALEAVNPEAATTPALEAAFLRVRDRVAEPDNAEGW